MNYSITIGAISISAPSIKELDKIADNLSLYADKFAPFQPKQVAKVIAKPDDKEPNVTAWLAANPDKGRFRMTKEELSSYGSNREEAAKARLISAGLPIASDTVGDSSGEGVTFEGDIDAGFIPEEDE